MVATGQDQPQGRKNKVQRATRTGRAGRQLAAGKGSGLPAWQGARPGKGPRTVEEEPWAVEAVPKGKEEAAGKEQHLRGLEARKAGADRQAPRAAATEQGAGRGRGWRRLIPG